MVETHQVQREVCVVAEIALWNKANQAADDAVKAMQSADAANKRVGELEAAVEKLQGELKAMKARMGKKQD